MRETMVRTQVYLPRDIYQRLQKRAEENDLTLAMQVREALVDYLEKTDVAEAQILRADDPIFQLIGAASSAEGDLSVNHDHYLYGWPKREPGVAPEASQLRQAQIAAGTRNAAFYNDEAIYLRDAGQLAEALQVLDAAQRAGIDDDYLVAVRASILQRQGKGEEASRLRQAQMAAGSRNAVFYNDEAIYLRNLGQWEEALAVLAKAEQAGVTDHYLLAIKVGLLEQLGQSAEASQAREKRTVYKAKRKKTSGARRSK